MYIRMRKNKKNRFFSRKNYQAILHWNKKEIVNNPEKQYLSEISQKKILVFIIYTINKPID